MAKKRVTIKQVAEEAGVSTQTVSRVINNRPDVAPDTRERVLQIIEHLRYQPSLVARSLIQGRSYTLGVVGYGLEYFGTSRNLSGIEQQANELGYTPLLNLVRQPENGDVEQLLRDMLSRYVDGILWAIPEIGSSGDWTRRVSQISVPVVFLSREPRPGLAVANADNRSGARLATRHLLDQGFQHVGLIAGPLGWWEARQRKLGWQDALAEAGLSVDDDLVVLGDWSAISGERGFGRLATQRPSVDAVFACNDQMALGVLKAARQLGRRVPEDLAVVGYDDIPEASFFCPPLSTVRQNMVELGRRAVTQLVHMIERGQEGKEMRESHSILLQPELVVRESSVSV